MMLLRLGAFTALALVTSQQANAQIIPRAEIQAGLSQFSAAGDSDSSLGFGAAAGLDYDAGGFIVGVEGTFWWPGSCFKAKRGCPAEVRTEDQGNFVNHKIFEEYGLALRAGTMVSPDTLFYVKGGVVRSAQRKEILPGEEERRGPAPGYIYDSYKRGGWTAGVGVEHQVSGPFYVKAEGRYSDYKRGQISGGTHMITGLLGLGVKFLPIAAPVILPPAPPPPPMAPATQTCPDGSVILATDVCPVPPPPPPPPPPAGERG